MKKQELITIIKTAVRQELKESLPKMIKEITKLHEQRTPSIQESDPVKLAEAALRNSKQSSKVVVGNKKDKPKIAFTKNQALNEALNATVGGVPQEGSLVSGYGEQTSVTDFEGNQVDVDALPDHVSNALTKDYSQLLKLVDKKKGN